MTTQGRVLRKRTLLVILDGFGLNPDHRNNAVHIAKTPHLDGYFNQYPSTALEASGPAVGLPEGQMGNSEVGHLTLGTGCVLRQDLVRIDDAIQEGSFFDIHAFVSACEIARNKQRPLHLVGLVSDGGVHSHLNHLLALVDLAGRYGVRPNVHVITDGRDTSPHSAHRYLRQLEPRLQQVGGRIASLCGRFYAMDRDQRWERTATAWALMVSGQGRFAESADRAIETAYAAGESDEFVQPTRVQGGALIEREDPVILFNFRNDRFRQLVEALACADFPHFDRPSYRGNAQVVTMTSYGNYPVSVAFCPQSPPVTLAETLSQAGLTQLHCAETEKYPHVTYFFNGGEELPVQGEDRVMLPSPKVRTYDLQPEMNARGVADAVIESIEGEQHDFIVVNFANGDMVGHSGVRAAIIQAVEAMDAQVGRVLDAAVASGYACIVTADHGNCDEMIDPETGEPHTQHTRYPVPCMVIDSTPVGLYDGGGLANVAPTVLALMGLPKPEGMAGTSLIYQEEIRIAI